MPVLSLQTGGKIATLSDPVINPHNLIIEAFYVTTKLSQTDQVVFTNDIREVGPKGAIVDSDESLMELDNLVRLEELLKINFELLDKKVETENRRSVGRVSDYTVDDKGFVIQKLYVRPPALKALTNSDFIIGRRQIVEVTDSKIIVKDADIKLGSKAKRPSFNPVAH